MPCDVGSVASMTHRSAMCRLSGVVALLILSCSCVLIAPQSANAATTSEKIAAAVLKQLNKDRAGHHLKALKMNTKLVKSAHAHNLAMATAKQLSHQLNGEPGLATRITKVGYRYSSAGENIGENTDHSVDGALALESLMYNEKPPNDGHRKNILNKQFTHVGIDVLIDKHGKLWLTQDFGRPL